MRIIGIIPARYASSRFPGKPLVEIAGKTMIQRVYEQVRKSETLNDVFVATDDKRIYDEVKNFGGSVMITSTGHTNGTERCAEVAEQEHADYYINIQGDEPFVHPGQIDSLASILNGEVEIGTLIKRITDPLLLDRNSVMKVVINQLDEAIYFSRNCIPHVRDIDRSEWLDVHHFWKHIGIYAYRRDILQKIVKLPQGDLEKAESLEQLRWIENGYKIKIARTGHESMSIDTPEDLDLLMEKLENGEIS